ncbi:MAG: ribonuclease P protein component [Deltaproteobacteria bacterium]|nr:ribonuclease P protein component [Deltaproteobacteria bacterium]MBW2421410.1 ribonuclease P protein component [Deltaproteobacteria bacterium]
MQLGTGRLGRSDRLRRRKEFERVSREGKRRASRGFVVLIAPAAGSGDRSGVSAQEVASAHGGRRLGITASRRVGNAVTRNRMKRAIREWFRCHRDELEEDVDIVVIVRRDATALERAGLERELSSLTRRAEHGGGTARRTR